MGSSVLTTLGESLAASQPEKNPTTVTMADSGYEDLAGLEGVHFKSPPPRQDDSGQEEYSSLESSDKSARNKERLSSTLQQQGARQQERNRRHRSADRTSKAGLNLWDVQKTLNRGDFVQGVFHLSPVRSACLGIICTPVEIGRADGHLRHTVT